MENIFSYKNLLTMPDIQEICNAKYLKLINQILISTTDNCYAADIEYYVKVKSIDYKGSIVYTRDINSGVYRDSKFIINGVYLVHNPENKLTYISTDKIEFEFKQWKTSIIIMDEGTFKSNFDPIYKKITRIYNSKIYNSNLFRKKNL